MAKLAFSSSAVALMSLLLALQFSFGNTSGVETLYQQTGLKSAMETSRNTRDSLSARGYDYQRDFYTGERVAERATEITNEIFVSLVELAHTVGKVECAEGSESQDYAEVLLKAQNTKSVLMRFREEILSKLE